MKNKWNQYKKYLNNKNTDVINKKEININNNSFNYLSNNEISQFNAYSYIQLSKLIKYNNDKNNYSNKNLMINKEIIFFLWSLMILSLVNPILNEKILSDNRKLSSIQTIKLKVYNSKMLQIINPGYIPNRVYINGIKSSINKKGYININSDLPINDITLEWEEKIERYIKLFKDINSIIEVDFVNFDMTRVTSTSSMFYNCFDL